MRPGLLILLVALGATALSSAVLTVTDAPHWVDMVTGAAIGSTAMTVFLVKGRHK